MRVILLLIESVSRALILKGLAGSRRERAKVLQQSPTTQATFTRSLMSVKPSAGIEKTRQAVHQAVHEVAGAMAAGVRVADHVVRHAVPDLRRHFQHALRPVALLTPLTERRHPLAKLLGGGRAVDFPHAAVQLAGFVAAVADLQKT